MGWFSDSFDKRTEDAPKQGFLESDRAYKERVYLEGKERIIEDATGSQPERGFFESESSYRSRIAHEANERVVEQIGGDAPKKGFFESEDHYRERMHHEANARVVEGATGETPRPGLFESTESFHARMADEARARIVEEASGSAPKQGFFEGHDTYKVRVNREAREIKASRPKRERSSRGSSSDYSSYSSSSGRSIGGWVALGVVAVVGFLIYQNVQESNQRRAQWEQRVQAVSGHVGAARNASAQGQFELAEQEIAAAYGLATDDTNLQQQVRSAADALFSAADVPASGWSVPVALQVEVESTVGFGTSGGYYTTLRESRRLSFRDANWVAMNSTGERFTPRTLIEFLRQRGKKFGPFRDDNAAWMKLSFASTDGRPKKIFLVR